MNNRYIKIYHYSPVTELKEIDTSHYGECVSKHAECKHGKHGLDKSFYYTINEPQECFKFSSYKCYEIYLPYDDKKKIYDMGTNDTLYLEAKKQLEAAAKDTHIAIPESEIIERWEALIKENGYIGWMNSRSEVPHSLALFKNLTTKRPEGSYCAYSWHTNGIVENTAKKNVLVIDNSPTQYLAQENLFKPAPEITSAPTQQQGESAAKKTTMGNKT